LSVTCVEYPEGVIQPGQAAQMFNTHRDGMVKGTQGRLIREADITLDGNPGKEFEWESKNGVFGKVRVYVLKNRFYSLITASAERNRAIPTMDRFLNSFRLLPERDASP